MNSDKAQIKEPELTT